jgi:hypothetical protein
MLDMANPFGAAWKNVRRARKVITDHNLKVGPHTHLNPPAHRAVQAFIPSSTCTKCITAKQVLKDKRAHTIPCRMRNCRERGSSLGGYWWCAPGVAAWCTHTRSKPLAIMRPWPRWVLVSISTVSALQGPTAVLTGVVCGVHAVMRRWQCLPCGLATLHSVGGYAGVGGSKDSRQVTASRPEPAERLALMCILLLQDTAACS